MRWVIVVHDVGPGRAADLLLHDGFEETVGLFHLTRRRTTCP